MAKVLISEIIKNNVLAKQITEDYKGEKLLLVCILREQACFQIW